jgi:hypothetical protein
MIVYGINQSNYDILSALSYVRITGNPLLLHVKARTLVHHFNITIIVRNVVYRLTTYGYILVTILLVQWPLRLLRLLFGLKELKILVE